MDRDIQKTSAALLQSLLNGNLLINDLPEAVSFDRALLQMPREIPLLNSQQKLGHLYEDALAVLLRESPQLDLLAQNLQVQKDAHHTLGELDFLIRERDGGRLIATSRTSADDVVVLPILFS